MKKKIIILVIIALIISSGVLGYDIIKINIKEANRTAIENDKYLEIDALNLKVAKIDYEDALKKAKITSRYTFNGQITAYYIPYNKETSVQLTILNNNKTIKLIEKDVLAASYDYYINNANYNMAKDSYEQLKKQFEETKDISDIEYKQLKYNLQGAKIKLQSAKNTLVKTTTKIQEMLQSDKIVDISTMVLKTPYEFDFETILDIAKKENIDLYIKSRNKEAKKIYFDITKKYYKENTVNYINALASFNKATLDYEKQINNLEIKILNDLNNLKTAYDYIQLEQLNNSIKQEEYNVAVIQYEKGYISKNILDSKKSNLEGAKNQLIIKEKSYSMSLKEFEIYTGFMD